MYQCCIFDLDGTIINTLHSLKKTVNETIKQFGYGPIDEYHVRYFVGDGYKKLVERTLVYCGDTELTHYGEALTVYDEMFKKYCLYQMEPYAGMPDFLKMLKEKGIRIAVVTNKAHDRAVECVETVYGPGFFDKITGEGKGMKCKPDPEGALKTAEEFHVEPSECLYFGDTNTDMKTGINAGMDTVGVLWGFRDRAELEAFKPKYIISHPDEIRSLFNEIYENSPASAGEK